MIVFDADKLETIGAIGIARAFAWVGKNNAHITKDRHIVEYLHTKKAKEMAKKRKVFFEDFFIELEKEIKGVG